MGTLTINTNSEQDQRITTAFGKHLRLGRKATGAEVRKAIIQHIWDIVQNKEYEAQEEAITVADLDLS